MTRPIPPGSRPSLATAQTGIGVPHPAPPRHRPVPPGHDDELILLGEVQAYLASRRSGVGPEPALAAAWGRFYRSYSPLVEEIARDRRGRVRDPEDRVQEVWRVLIARLEGFRYEPSRGHFRAWLLTVARRRLADCDRADRRAPRPHADPRAVSGLAGREEDPAVAHERDRDRRRVDELLTRLRAAASPTSYRVLHLRSIEGRTVPEVAAALGLTADQVRARHHRMMRKLSDLLGPDRGPPRREYRRRRATAGPIPAYWTVGGRPELAHLPPPGRSPGHLA